MADLSAPVTALADGLIAGDRAALARAITLVESRRADHRRQASSLVHRHSPSGLPLDFKIA